MLATLRPVALLAAALAVGAALLAGGADAQGPDAPKPPRAVPFDQARGTLPWPVEGRQVVGFGQPTAEGWPSKGIVIVASPGAQVVSPCDGMVVYAGEFRRYGGLVIVSPGDGYHCLLAGLSKIDATLGQRLSAGDPIGTLTRSGDGAAPRLGLELHKDQRAIDPAPWLRKS